MVTIAFEPPSYFRSLQQRHFITLNGNIDDVIQMNGSIESRSFIYVFITIPKVPHLINILFPMGNARSIGEQITHPYKPQCTFLSLIIINYKIRIKVKIGKTNHHFISSHWQTVIVLQYFIGQRQVLQCKEIILAVHQFLIFLPFTNGIPKHLL